MRYAIIVCAGFLASQPLAAQTTGRPGIAEWRKDLAIIAEQVPAKHPSAFYRMPKAAWDSAVRSIDARLPQMSRNEATVAFMQLVALVNDGHTSINPLFDRNMEMHFYPIDLHLFEDGLFITSAAPRYASLLGAKVVRVGNRTADEAIAAVASTIGHENEWFIRSWAPSRLVLAEVLNGLGIVSDDGKLTLVVERSGRQESVAMSPAARLQPLTHNPNASDPGKNDWIRLQPSADVPLWARNAGMPYWWEFVGSDSTLYVSYRGVISMPNPTNQQFWRGVFEAADSLPVKRLVIDLRDNLGGNSFYNRQVVRGIVARPALDQRGKLFVITGGRTFSAAMNLLLDLEAWTNVTVVGEPAGNATVFFGDHVQIPLPVSGMTVNVSSLPWYPDDPRDRREFVAPRIYAAMSAADYRSNNDPAMRAILARGSKPPVVSLVEQAIIAGDTVSALNLAIAEIANPENRFVTPEAELNTLGYRLLDSNRSAGISLFRIITRAFPQSANAWDSLGEALVVAGQRDAGITAYRKALEISPGLPSAVQALERLH